MSDYTLMSIANEEEMQPYCITEDVEEAFLVRVDVTIRGQSGGDAVFPYAPPETTNEINLIAGKNFSGNRFSATKASFASNLCGMKWVEVDGIMKLLLSIYGDDWARADLGMWSTNGTFKGGAKNPNQVELVMSLHSWIERNRLKRLN